MFALLGGEYAGWLEGELSQGLRVAVRIDREQFCGILKSQCHSTSETEGESTEIPFQRKSWEVLKRNGVQSEPHSTCTRIRGWHTVAFGKSGCSGSEWCLHS